MRQVATTPRTLPALLLAGLVAGCAGSSLPVAETHPTGPDIGAILARQKSEQRAISATDATTAVASATIGRAAPVAAAHAVTLAANGSGKGSGHAHGSAHASGGAHAGAGGGAGGAH